MYEHYFLFDIFVVLFLMSLLLSIVEAMNETRRLTLSSQWLTRAKFYRNWFLAPLMVLFGGSFVAINLI